MNKALVVLFCLVLLPAWAVGSEAGLKHASIDVFDLRSIQRGAAYFANYCQGCHGLKLMRYSRIAADLKLDEEAMRWEILLGDDKIYDTMRTAMAPEDGVAAFGVAPPDLSLVVRARGADWVYSYLKGFYADAKTPFGTNNLVVKNVAMPNVLWELQGTQEPVVTTAGGEPRIIDVKPGQPGKMNAQEFDQVVTDLVTYLAYVSEPSKLERLPLGKYVILFLLFFSVVLYKLKKEYWKDIE